MNILCIDWALTNFHNLVELAHDGHRVYMMSDVNVPTAYYKSLGVEVVDWMPSHSEKDEFVKERGIDLVINQHPHVRYSVEGVKYVGLNVFSAHLETRKLWCRRGVEAVGVKAPRILDDISIPCVVKTRKAVLNSELHCAWVVKDEEHLEWMKRNWGFDKTDYYVEEYIDGIEVNIEFVVSGGKWSISHCQQSSGEEDAKLAGNFQHHTKHIRYHELSDDNRYLCLDESEKILDWVATLGGSFQGQITGIIKDGEFYFIEINSRLGATNSTPIFVRGDEYLKSLDGDPDLLGDAIYNADVEKMVVHPLIPTAYYPFHLHEKYGVSIPCGLDIINDKYLIAHTYRNQGAGITIVDDHIPQEFKDELKRWHWYE
jgi:hypothetical protein